MNHVITPLDLIHGQMFRKIFFFFRKKCFKSIRTSNVPVVKSRNRTPELYVYQSLIPKGSLYLFLSILMAS